MDSIKKKMQSLAAETDRAQVKILDNKMLSIFNVTQERCARWEKEVNSTNTVADQFEEQVAVIRIGGKYPKTDFLRIGSPTQK